MFGVCKSLAGDYQWVMAREAMHVREVWLYNQTGAAMTAQARRAQSNSETGQTLDLWVAPGDGILLWPPHYGIGDGEAFSFAVMVERGQCWSIGTYVYDANQSRAIVVSVTMADKNLVLVPEDQFEDSVTLDHGWFQEKR